MYSMKACASAAAGIEDNENGVCGGEKKKSDSNAPQTQRKAWLGC